jgi:hypothetical protein
MANRRSPEWKKEAAVVFWALGDWRAKERVEWKERELVLLFNQKRGGEGACTGGCCSGEVADGRAAGRHGMRARGPGRSS